MKFPKDDGFLVLIIIQMAASAFLLGYLAADLLGVIS